MLKVEVIDGVLEGKQGVEYWGLAGGEISGLGIVIEEINGQESLDLRWRNILAAQKLHKRTAIEASRRDPQIKKVLNRADLCLICDCGELRHCIVLFDFAFKRRHLVVESRQVCARKAVGHESLLERDQLTVAVLDLVVEGC